MRGKYVVFKDSFGRRYRINRKKVDEVLAGTEDRQSNLILGCFKSVGYDLEHCKSCRFYEWKCRLSLKSFVEEESLFKRWKS